MCAPKRKEGAPKTTVEMALDGDLDRLPNGPKISDAIKDRSEKLGFEQPKASVSGVPQQKKRGRFQRSSAKYRSVPRSGGSRGRRSLFNP